jgi:hypothetical protein
MRLIIRIVQPIFQSKTDYKVYRNFFPKELKLGMVLATNLSRIGKPLETFLLILLRRNHKSSYDDTKIY